MNLEKIVEKIGTWTMVGASVLFLSGALTYAFNKDSCRIILERDSGQMVEISNTHAEDFTKITIKDEKSYVAGFDFHKDGTIDEIKYKNKDPKKHTLTPLINPENLQKFYSKVINSEQYKKAREEYVNPWASAGVMSLAVGVLLSVCVVSPITIYLNEKKYSRQKNSRA